MRPEANREACGAADIQHDMYRPYYYHRLSAGLGTDGKPVAWTYRVSGSSVAARYVPSIVKNGIDPDAMDGAAQPPYAFPNIHVNYVRVESPGIPTAFWRGVGLVHNVFVGVETRQRPDGYTVEVIIPLPAKP